MALSGVAAASPITLTDLSTTITVADGLGYLYSNGVITDNSAIDGDAIFSLPSATQTKVQTNVTFTLNLTAAASAVSEGGTYVNIVNVNMPMDVGLYLTSTGFVYGYDANNTRNPNLTFNTLAASKYSFEGSDGNKYITLTFAQHKNGLALYDNSGTALISDNNYTSSSNTTMESIYINTTYIEGVQVNPEWPSSFKDVNTGFDTTMKAQLVPEPTTATLSLLALAGLAARRRRK